MTYLSLDDIDRIAIGFIDQSLPAEDWTHAAHFATAIWLIHQPDFDVFAQMPGMIRKYNEASGGINSDTEGYHETITRASLRAARHHYEMVGPGTPLDGIVHGLMSGPCGQPGWLLTYWSKPCLFSIKARREWVEPDLTPLPF